MSSIDERIRKTLSSEDQAFLAELDAKHGQQACRHAASQRVACDDCHDWPWHHDDEKRCDHEQPGEMPVHASSFLAAAGAFLEVSKRRSGGVRTGVCNDLEWQQVA